MTGLGEKECPWAPFWCVHRTGECDGPGAEDCLFVSWHGSSPLASSIGTLRPIAEAGLSRRELGVLEAVMDEGDVAAVASALHISPHTVLNHLRTIRRKLGVHTMADLFRLLLQSCLTAREEAAQS